MTYRALLLALLTVTAAYATETVPDYTIGLEDALRISVWGEPNLNMTVRVRPDGKISFPLVNDIAVVGLSSEQLRQALADRLSKYVRDPNVTVIVEEINSYRVFVLGEVRNQGALNLRRPVKLLQVIATAGGLTEFSKKEIVLMRTEGGVDRRIRVDYRKLLAGDEGATDVVVKPGDVIVVN